MAFWNRRKQAERQTPLSWDAYQSYFTYGNNLYGPLMPQQTLQGSEVSVSGNFAGLVEGAYKANGPIFACMLVRMLLFSEARFAFRELVDGRPGDLFGGTDGRNPGNRDLAVLSTPWPNGTTGDLLTRAITDADLAGSHFLTREGSRLRRLRPDWVTIVLESPRKLPYGVISAYDADIAGYLYHPGGPHAGNEPDVFDVSQVAQFSPIPDPTAPWRGMSWLNPIISEIEADMQATQHKKQFFVKGATPNMVITGLPSTKEQFDRWVELFREKHEGVGHAYENLFLSGAVDAKVVGADFKQLDFKITQGAGETRIAAAAGVPPVIVGLSEGLQAATYSNYSQARRRFADGTMRPLWRNVAGSLAKLVRVPDGAELWYDDRDVAFLREDEKDAAEIISTKATSIRTLTDGGYEPKSVVDAVEAGDLRKLKHTGLVPVQLTEPGAVPPTPPTNPGNGNGGGKVPDQLAPMKAG